MPTLLKELQRSDFEEAGTSKAPLILAENLGIRYLSEKTKSDDFKSHTHNLITGLFKKENQPQKEPLWALKDINFSAYPGDVLGVIGANGAGKTTLCRAVLGMLRPNTGRIDVNGEISSLLTLGAGFNPLLTGRDNIYLNGMMLGMSRKNIRELTPVIEEFSGIDQRFRNLPLKYYSKGMRARLGFSIAAAMEAEVMVIDEVLSAGDLDFQERAAERMQELVRAAKMVLVVTHDTSFVEKYCNKAIWLDKGGLAASGKAGDVARQYKEHAAAKAKPKPDKKKFISLCETRVEVSPNRSINVEKLGIYFKIDRKPFWALKEVTFNVREKEIVGIIGPNGAGKTTLCRALCGLYREDSGMVEVNGTVTALLSFGAGFDPQLNGLDNIYLNGMMLGMPRREIQFYEKQIIEFAELEKAIHKAVKYYSSGMKSRLGFSIAAMLDPDILVIDEALSAGDIAFKEKAALRMQDMLGDAKSVIIVTHSLGIVEKLCTRAIWLQEGRIKHDGDPKETVVLYKESVKNRKKHKKVTYSIPQK